MIRSVWRITRNSQDAEDAMQTALLVVWKRRGRVVGHAAPPALILKICADTAHSIARRRARDLRRTKPPAHVNEPVDHALSPWLEFASREMSDEILAAIHRLSRRQAVAVTLRVFEELPYEQIVSVSSNEGPELLPPVWSMCPELACRPPMGLGARDMEPVLEMHPPEGPPGCVRLSIRWSGNPDENRYWLDPQRDFIVVRTDWVTRVAASQEKVTLRTTVEETARSPQGVWYASKIRRSHPDPVGNVKVVGDVAVFYVDFDVNLPDSLFEPPTPGKIR